MSLFENLLGMKKKALARRRAEVRRNLLEKAVERLEVRCVMDASYFSLSGGNLTQNWSDAAQISTNDDWSGVPSIEGYLGQSLTTSTGADPQTVVTTSTGANDLDVLANQVNPDTVSQGGVGEFDTLTNPTIALNGSGTADAPYLLVYLNGSGRQDIKIQANIRDLDGSADDAIMPLAVQYRVGSTGDFINLPGAFIADATEIDAATLVTPIDVTLPAAANNAAQIQVRFITANAVGADEWIGVDDINISSTPAAAGLPFVSSVVRGNPTTQTTNATSVDFTVTFSQAVTGVNAADFGLLASTVVGASITSVTPVSTSVYTVKVNSGTTNGTLDLDVLDDDTIKSVADATPLGGAGTNNGGFTAGETYTIDRTKGFVSYATVGATVTQNFDSLPSDGTYTLVGPGPFNVAASPTGSTAADGWFYSKIGGTGTNALFRVDDGNTPSGGIWSYGAFGDNERAFGSVGSSTTISRLGAVFQNDSTSTLNSITITYTGEQWRDGDGSSANTLSFEYALGATSIDTGTFIPTGALNFVSPTIASTFGVGLDGNDAANQSAKTATISGINWAPGQKLVIRWNDADDGGGDDGLAIDDFSIKGEVLANTAPTFTSANTANFVSGTPGSFQVTTTAIPAATYSLTGAPAWLSIGASTGLLTGTPPAVSDSTPFNFTINAVNGTAPNAAQAFTLNVLPTTISYSTSGSDYTQDFDGLPNTGTFTLTGSGPVNLFDAPVNGTNLVGWQIAEAGTNPVKLLVDDGNSTTGANRSYGAAGSTDRALGTIASGSHVGQFGAVLVNNSGAALNNFTVTFTGEQWRHGAGVTGNTLAFSYSLDGTDIKTGTFVDVPELDFTAPVLAPTDFALDGNASANRTTGITFEVTGITWAAGQKLVLRFTDANDTSSDDGLAIDDFTFSAGDPVAGLVIDSNGGGATAAISIPEGTTAVTTVTTGGAAGVTYSLNGGADAAKFAINATTGALTFIAAPSFGTPTDAGANNVYDVIVRAQSSAGSDTQAIAVTVTQAAAQAIVIAPNAGSTAVELKDTVTGGKNDNLVITRVGANFVVEDVSGVAGSIITVNGFTGVVGNGTAKVSIPIAQIEAIGKFLVLTGLGNDTVTLGTSGTAADPIPSTGLEVDLGAGSNQEFNLGVGTLTTGDGANTTLNAWTLFSAGASTGANGNVIVGAAGTVDLKNVNRVSGGEGDDTFTINSPTVTGITIDGNGGTDTIRAIAAAAVNTTFDLNDASLVIGTQTLTLASFESADLIGNTGNDTFDVTGWTKAAGKFTGGSGTDRIVAAGDTSFILDGTAATSTLKVGSVRTYSLVAMEAAALTGGAGGNNFVINEWKGDLTIDSLGGSDLVSITRDGNFTLAKNAIANNVGVNISGKAFNIVNAESVTLIGGASANTYDLTAGYDPDFLGTTPAIALSLKPGSGTAVDVLRLTAAGNFNVTQALVGAGPAFTVTLVAGGKSIDTTQFERLNLVGDAGANSFTFNGYTGGGSIDGGSAGTDSLSYTRDSNFTLSPTSLKTGANTFSLAGIDSASLTGGASANGFSIQGWVKPLSISGGSGGFAVDRLLTTTDAALVIITDTSFAQSSGAATWVLSGLEAVSVVTTTASDSKAQTFDITGWTNAASLFDGTAQAMPSTSINAGGGTDTLVSTKGGDQRLSAAGYRYDLDGAGTASREKAWSIGGFEAVTLTGDANANWINARFWSGTTNIKTLGGDDVIFGGSGADTMDGGDGNDWLSGFLGNDTLTGGNGNDVVVGAGGTDTVGGGNGNDIVTGGQTIHDGNKTSVDQIIAFWKTVTDSNYAASVVTLRDTGVTGKKLNIDTVKDDNLVDAITGGTGATGKLDWFLAELTAGATEGTETVATETGEVVTDIK